MATLIRQGNVIQVATPYHKEFVALLKEKVPSNARAWDGQAKVWNVDAKYFDAVKGLAELHFDYVDVVHDRAQAKQMRQTILIEYLGRCKETDWNVAFANAQVNGAWNTRVSETVLRAYFENATRVNTSQTTLYQLLGAKSTASLDELKRAYFRAAKVWHPDLNADPDAAEMFRKVKSAWDVLENPLQRAKYDAGLKLQAVQVNVPSWQTLSLATYSDYGYRAPATCGLVDCEVEQGIKRTITQIYDWQDDTRVIGGLTLIRVASWDKQTQSVKTKWESI